LSQLSRRKDRSGNEQHTLAPFVHLGILRYSPFVRYWNCDTFSVPEIQYMEIRLNDFSHSQGFNTGG
jgi:hypothetical protein